MKIGNTEGNSSIERLASGERRAATGLSKTTRSGTEGDVSAKVELSGAAAQLLGDAGTSAEFDAAKVARIAQAIAEGKYEINADVIADKLIANAEALLGKAAR